MQLFVIGPSDNGEGRYSLLTEHGETLAEHWCSSSGFALGDLEGHRPERQIEWRERFGEYEVVLLTDEAEVEKLLAKNKEWF